jgi:hypothetical protein
MILSRDARKPSLFLGALAALLLLWPVLAGASVTPAQVNLALKPGESATIEKTVEVPAVPPKLDLCLLIDLSGSYLNDLPNIISLSPGLFDSVRAQVADSRFCVGSFVDYPFSPWGSSGTGDYAYQLNQGLTTSKATWTGAISGLVVRFGGDGPESQYEGLYQMATGAGRDVPPLGGAASLGDVSAGQNPAFRADANKVVAITTDAPFHIPGTPNCTAPAPCPFGYPGPSRDDTVNALVAAGIKVIAVKAPGSGAEMDDVAGATGGAVVSTGNTSAEIATAILAGLSALKQDITAVPVGCNPLLISYVPTSHPDVTGPTTVMFDETIEVPSDVAPGTLFTCSVDFKADDTVIATQHITVQVPLTGRMTGGGRFFTADGQRVTHGFSLNCYSGAGGTNLEVNWNGNAFHLESLDHAACFDNPLIGEEHPRAGFDTYQGKGTGSLNGTPGYTAEWRLTDAGEPGGNDVAEISILDPANNVVLNADGTLRNGNHQAHPD